MGKSHRDNHKARLKRGKVAFDKKAKRRMKKKKEHCNICGVECRITKLVGGLCPMCLERK